MIKFFRHIRKSLIEQNKMGKYFKYAIGEIILVVIGILIALQINNWNQNRLDKKFELTILKEIKTALQYDIGTHDMLKQRAKIKEDGIKSLFEMMASNQTYADSTLLKTYNKMIMGFIFTYNLGAYEAIKSVGLDKVSNDSLREILVLTYEGDLPRLDRFMNEKDWFNQGNAYKLKLHNALWKRIRVQKPDGSWKIVSKPINNQSFLNQNELLDRIKIEQDVLNSVNGTLNFINIKLKDCLTAVDKELENHD